MLKKEDRLSQYLTPNEQIGLSSTIELYEEIKKKTKGPNIGIKRRLAALYEKREALYKWQEKPYSQRRQITSPAMEFLT
tara:strand:- start:241 stop:477 length:237 start_codon:yes stop_codon:yes gene_type:complete